MKTKKEDEEMCARHGRAHLRREAVEERLVHLVLLESVLVFADLGLHRHDLRVQLLDLRDLLELRLRLGLRTARAQRPEPYRTVLNWLLHIT